MIRAPSVGASSGYKDPFNPKRHFLGSSSHCVLSSLVHRDNVENDGNDVDNDDDDMTLSDDEDLHIPHHTHASNHELRESAAEISQAECDNEIETLPNEEELNDN